MKWTSSDWQTIEDCLADGGSLLTAARRIGRPANAVARGIQRRGQTITAMRNARTLAGVASLFGVSESTVRKWIGHRALYAHRNGARVETHRKQAHYLISDLSLMAFLDRRRAWPLFDPGKITCPDWRAAALDARTAGHWLTTEDIASYYRYAAVTVRWWVNHGWEVEYVRYGRAYYVWAERGEVPPLPSFTKAERGRRAA